MFDGGTYGEEQRNRAPTNVAPGPDVTRIALRDGPMGTFAFQPSQHLRLADARTALCGRAIFPDGSNQVEAVDLGICQVCRARASALRAVVRAR